MSNVLHDVERIADEVLFPAALAVDATERVPESHLALLADTGLYGLAGEGRDESGRLCAGDPSPTSCE